MVVANLLPAQNISVYTISPGNVSDSLDATIASKPCRKEVCGGTTGWLGACCNALRSRYSGSDKICHSRKQGGHPQAKERELGRQYEDHCQHSS